MYSRAFYRYGQDGIDRHAWIIGRKRVGRIAITNSDAGASAYTNVAIDQAWRAVGDLHEV
jgi:spermidine dehydrogenase